MSRRWRAPLALAAVLLVALGSASVDPGFWWRYGWALWRGDPTLPVTRLSPHFRIAGEGGGAWPRTTAQEAAIAPAALAQARERAARQGARALLVLREGHLVDAWYGDGGAAERLVDGGDLATLLRALAVAAAVGQGSLAPPAARAVPEAPVAGGSWRNPWSAAARAHFAGRPSGVALGSSPEEVATWLSRTLWRGLHAGDALLWRDACCVAARPADWLRVAQLYLGQGRFEGSTLVPAAGIATLALPVSVARGIEPLAANDLQMIAGPGSTRLWLSLREQLAILLVDPSVHDRIDDTTVPNILLRGLDARPAAGQGAPELEGLVPGHVERNIPTGEAVR